MEVTNFPETKAYDPTDVEKFPVIKNWLGQEGLQLIKTFMNEEKGNCKMAKRLFLVLSNKFRPHHNILVLSLQFRKLQKKSHESA